MFKLLTNAKFTSYALKQSASSFKSLGNKVPSAFYAQNRASKPRSPFIINKKQTQKVQSQAEVNSSATSSTFETNSSNNTEKDDIHAKRFIETQAADAEDIPSSFRNELYKFHFDNQMNSIHVDLDDINIINIENEETFHLIPRLEHNLEAVVRKPGIYTMESMAPLQADGGKFLRSIPSPDEIDFDRIPAYIPPSEDALLLKFARESKIKYVMSTSTISSVLSQIYYLFSAFRAPNFSNLSESYINEPRKYMISQRKPITNFLRKIDPEHGIYALDGDSGLFYFENNILMDLGKIIERSLTLPADLFNEALLKSRPGSPEFLIQDDHHRFMKLNNEICLRSQIDCHAFDPATGKPFVFEIKTRSVCPIRYDLPHYDEYLDYRINSYRGLHSSYEREYYDLIRGAFLKYSFQIKIGRMDGAFIAYHNTKEIFGFEYVQTKEIEKRVFGSELFAEISFVCCSKLLIVLIDSVLDALKDEKFEMLKIGFYACSNLRKMVIFTELYESQTEWSSHQLIHKTSEVQDEFDYFTKYKTLNNKVLKFEFFTQVYVNGVLQTNPLYEFTKGDQIELKYRFEKLGKANFIDYMNFLHEAYKFETMNIDLSYAGAWIK